MFFRLENNRISPISILEGLLETMAGKHPIHIHPVGYSLQIVIRPCWDRNDNRFARFTDIQRPCWEPRCGSLLSTWTRNFGLCWQLLSSCIAQKRMVQYCSVGSTHGIIEPLLDMGTDAEPPSRFESDWRFAWIFFSTRQ